MEFMGWVSQMGILLRVSVETNNEKRDHRNGVIGEMESPRNKRNGRGDRSGIIYVYAYIIYR